MAKPRGPAPKRSSERRRRNKSSKAQTVKPAGKAAAKVTPPSASSDWHPIAKDWFNSLKRSGQSQFYEPSDWQAARVVAQTLSKYLRQRKPSSMMFAAVWSAMGDLLTTEAERRRVRMEIEREGAGDESASAEVTAIADYRRRASRKS